MTAGETFLFLQLGVINGMFGLWLLSYASYWFLLVIDRTAVGINVVKVHWPDESVSQRLSKLGYLIFIVGVWLLPVLAFFKFMELPLRDELLPPLVVSTACTVLWLMLPLSLLASMNSESNTDILRIHVLLRLVRRWRITLAFYAYTFPLLLGCALVTYLALFGWVTVREAAETSSVTWLPELVEIWSWAFVLPLTAGVAATALLIYARLLGRLAWMMDFWDEEGETEVVEAREVIPEPSADNGLSVNHGRREAFSSTDDFEPPIPFAEEGAPVASPPKPATAVAPLATREPEAVPTERRLWVRGIYRFPWYRGSLVAWFFLSAGGLILGVLLRVQLMQLHD